VDRRVSKEEPRINTKTTMKEKAVVAKVMMRSQKPRTPKIAMMPEARTVKVGAAKSWM
jgi:hypothetical protein